ncbi:MAG: ribose ABC transporter permease [Spirochaetes bacterium]|nr:MAG: ribose ABC transporter permease [Spirochaetota bacterium]
MRFWEKYGIYLIAITTLIIFTILTPNVLSLSNIVNLLVQTSMVAIAAAGMTFAITGGAFDLSIGSILAVTTSVLCKNVPILGIFGAIVLALSVGAVLGVMNGLIVTKLRIQTFVATLATQIIYRGGVLIYTQGRDSDLFRYLDIKVIAGGRVLGLPVPIWITFTVFLAGYMIYKHTQFGMWVRAIGSNEEAARISGIKVDRTIIVIFVITAVTTVISGTIYTSQLLTGNGRLGVGFELEAITATILGGTALAGGKGKFWGTLTAAIILALMKNGMNLLGVQDFYQRLATGLILLLALSMGVVSERIQTRGNRATRNQSGDTNE